MIEKPNIIKGSLYGLLAFFCMAVFGILTKIAIQGSSVIWVSFVTYLAGTLVLIPFVMKEGLGFLKSEHYTYLIGRAVFGTIASFLYTISIHYIPIVNGTLLFNTAPIFIPLLTVLFLKVKVANSIWLAVGVGFMGIIAIIRPTEEILTQAGNLIGLSSGFFLAVAYLLMKILTKTDPGIRIIFYYLGIGTLMQLPLLAFAVPALPIEQGFYALISGIVLVLAQIALVRGYLYADASQIGVYQYATVAFVGLLNWLIWGTLPTTWDIIGILLVAIAGMIIIHQSKNTIPSDAGNTN